MRLQWLFATHTHGNLTKSERNSAVDSFWAGTLAEKPPSSVALDVNGVGFHLMIPLSTSQKLPAVGDKIKLLVHHVVREDAQLLFGFASEEERVLFRLLLSVSGVGPKLALVVLSGLGIGDLKRAIVEGSVPSYGDFRNRKENG